MAELKTQPTGQSVEEFLNSLPNEKKRRDSFTILELMRQATGHVYISKKFKTSICRY